MSPRENRIQSALLAQSGLDEIATEKAYENPKFVKTQGGPAAAPEQGPAKTSCGGSDP